MPVKINWVTVEHILEGSGHGVEICYAGSHKESDRLLLAFVVGFKWYHGVSDNVKVQILPPESQEFTKRGLEGCVIIAEVKKSLPWYLHRRRVPLGHMGKNFITWVNS